MPESKSKKDKSKPDPGSQEERTSPVGREDTKVAKRYTAALGVLRLWEGETKLDLREMQIARTLLAASIPHFRENDRKMRELREPLHGHGVVVGTLTGLNPLAVKLADKTRRFALVQRAAIVVNKPLDPTSLDEGQTVVIRSDEGQQPGRQLEAQLVATCARPPMSSGEIRRFWMREQGVKGR